MIRSICDKIQEALHSKVIRGFEHLDTRPIPGTHKNEFITTEEPEEMYRVSDVNETIEDVISDLKSKGNRPLETYEFMDIDFGEMRHYKYYLADAVDAYIANLKEAPGCGLAARNNELMMENKQLKDELIEIRRYRDSLEKRVHDLSIALEHSETKV